MKTEEFNLKVIALVNASQTMQRMCKVALPKFNWGASFLDANAIKLLNEAPLLLSKALQEIEPHIQDLVTSTQKEAS